MVGFILTAEAFVRGIAAVRGSITEKILPDAGDRGQLAAGQLAGVAQLLGEGDAGKGLPLPGGLVAVVDHSTPVARLLLHVKGKTWRTPNCLQTLKRKVYVEQRRLPPSLCTARRRGSWTSLSAAGTAPRSSCRRTAGQCSHQSPPPGTAHLEDIENNVLIQG